MRYFYFLLLFLAQLNSLLAQPVLRSVENKEIVRFKSPSNGDSYVPAKTTIIARLFPSVVRGHSVADFVFTVKASASGDHPGKVTVSDDNQTIIFKPDSPFSLDEAVEAQLILPRDENVAPINFNFRISPLSDSEQWYRLNLLKAAEKAQLDAFTKKQPQVNAKPSMQFFPLDTLPPLFPKIVIDVLDAANVAPGNVFLAPTSANCITIVDNAGIPQFVRDIRPNGADDFKLESGGRVSYFKLEKIIPQGNLFQGTVYILDDHFQEIDQYQCGNGYFTDDHDFRLLPDGHALMMAYDAQDMDMRVVTGNSGASKKATVIGCIIQELDLQKNVIWQWRTWDHLQITDVANLDLTSPNRTLVDYAHLNSIELDTDGNVIASFRAMDNIIKIKRDSQGKVIWRWGGKDNTINYFTFLGDTLKFSAQHDARRLPNGHITIFDNGNYHTTQWGDGSYHDTSFSRAVEYELDENNLTARAVWQYRDLPYSFASGNTQRLPNGNTFIGLGAQALPNAVEVTPDGKKVFQLSLPDNPYNYRSFRYEWPPKNSVVSDPKSDIPLSISNISPNPASKAAMISFSSPKEGMVLLELTDILGTTLRTQSKNISVAGLQSLGLDLSGIRNGVYLCKLTLGGAIATRMLVVQK
ncbi:MAG: aryl-sulfate sulfotransferase [Ignavibacteriota bacterium]